MITDFFLIVGNTGSIRVTKNQPDLKWNEVSIHLKLSLPNSLFQKPVLQGSINVTEKDVPPINLSPEMKNNIEQAIEAAAGVQVKLEFVQPENP